MASEYSPYKSFHHLNSLITKRPVLCYFLLTHRCNNNCSICINHHFSHFDKNDELDFDFLMDIAKQMRDMGVKAISFSGGEPLYHKDFSKYAEELLKMGFDLGLISNGSFLDKENIKVLSYFKWVRFSINAISEKVFTKFHSNKPVANYWNNFVKFIPILKSNAATIGSSFLISKNNLDEVYEFALWSKQAGFNTCRYSYVKTINGDIKYSDEEKRIIQLQLDKAVKLSDNSFNVLPLLHRLNLKIKKNYKHCYQSDLAFCITANGNVYSCCALQNSDKGFYGSLKDSSLEDIWQTKKVIDITTCPVCWNDKKNEFMEYVMSVPKHRNFL